MERRTAFLDEEQLRRAETLAKAKVASRVWTYYAGPSGYAYFESHAVRTMNETFMAVLNPDGSVRAVELLAFHEPDDYLPGGRWLAQFQGKKAEDDLYVRRGIRNIAGSSLTSQALAEGVRRVLAVHQVIHEGR